MKFINENKKKIIAALAIILVLVFAFWYGNGTKESRGFEVQGRNDVMTQAASSVEDNTNGQRENESTQAASERTEAETEETANESAETVSSASVDNEGSDGTDRGEANQSSSDVQQPETEAESDKAFTCTISISCATILNNMDSLNPDKKGLVPEDGWILKPVTVGFAKGESVFDVLNRVCQSNKIHLDSSFTPLYQTVYIKAINNLYERDCGNLSGWNYKVNGNVCGVGASLFKLSDGDVIEWLYTCDLGKDI